MPDVLTSEQWDAEFAALQQALSRRFGVNLTNEQMFTFLQGVTQEYANESGLDIASFGEEFVEFLPLIINRRLGPGNLVRQIRIEGADQVNAAISKAVLFKDELDAVILDALVPPEKDLTGASQADLLSAAVQAGFLTPQSSPDYVDYLTKELLPQLRSQWQTQQALHSPEQVGEFGQWATGVLQLQRENSLLQRPTFTLGELEFREREDQRAVSASGFLGPLVAAGIVQPGETGEFLDYLSNQVLPQVEAQLETFNAGLQARGEKPLTIAEFTQSILAEQPDVFSREAVEELRRSQAIGSAFRRSTDFRRDVALGRGPPGVPSLESFVAGSGRAGNLADSLERVLRREEAESGQEVGGLEPNRSTLALAQPAGSGRAGNLADSLERVLRREEAESGQEVGGLEPNRSTLALAQREEPQPGLAITTRPQERPLGSGQNSAVQDLQQRQRGLIKGLPGEVAEEDRFEAQRAQDTDILRAIQRASGGGAFGRYLLSQLPGLQEEFAAELKGLQAPSEDKQRAFENLAGQGLTQQEQAAGARFLTQPRGRKFRAFLRDRTPGLREQFGLTPAGEAESERVRLEEERVRLEEESEEDRRKRQSLRSGGTTIIVGGRR